MNKERLLLLAERLEKVPPENFFMNYWFGANPDQDEKDVERIQNFMDEYGVFNWGPPPGADCLKAPDMGALLEQQECGFAGCALGWATTIPEFKEAGLCIVNGSPAFKVDNHHVVGYSAAQSFFDIIAAHWLFDPEQYEEDEIRPEHVAARIREMVAKEE